MTEFLLVSALLPSFAIGLFLVARLQPSIAGSPSKAMANSAPQLYAGFVIVAVLLAIVLTGFDAGRLGLQSPSVLDSQLTGYLIAVPVALAVAVAMFLVELSVASIGLSRRGTSAAAPSSAESATRTRSGTAAPSREVPQSGTTVIETKPVPAIAAVTELVNRPLAFGAIALVTAVGEELLFRGLLFGGLRDNVPTALALTMQAVMFGANHVSFGARNVFTKSISGVSWGLLTIAFGSVLVAICSHVFFQYLVFQRLRRQGSNRQAAS